MRLILAAILVLWMQLFVALVPTWRNGDYYSYGWFVPLLVAWLAWRRWRIIRHASLKQCEADTACIPPVWVALCCLMVCLLVPLRIIVTADPSWRPPLLLHAGLVVCLTHLLLWRAFGRGVSLGLLPITVVALSAVPYPWQFERDLIRALTGMVLAITRECFLLLGKPVELVGERLIMAGEVVEVTDGCSGIRSFQSLVMVALFFGELFFLSAGRRVALVATAGLVAIACNTLRAFWLADLHFSRGPEAAAAAHDRLGHATFALSAILLWFSAYAMLHAFSRSHLILRRTVVSHS